MARANHALPLSLIIFIFAVPSCGDDDGGQVPRIDAAPAIDAAPMIDAAAAAVVVVDCDQVTPAEEVVMDDLAFQPASISIGPGDTVQWTNQDSEPHTVTSGNPGEAGAGALFDSGTIAVGATFCLTFNATDAFEYFCALHPVVMDDGLVTVD
jgi:plastocyanin